MAKLSLAFVLTLVIVIAIYWVDSMRLEAQSRINSIHSAIENKEITKFEILFCSSKFSEPLNPKTFDEFYKTATENSANREEGENCSITRMSTEDFPGESYKFQLRLREIIEVIKKATLLPNVDSSFNPRLGILFYSKSGKEVFVVLASGNEISGSFGRMIDFNGTLLGGNWVNVLFATQNPFKQVLEKYVPKELFAK